MAAHHLQLVHRRREADQIAIVDKEVPRHRRAVDTDGAGPVQDEVGEPQRAPVDLPSTRLPVAAGTLYVPASMKTQWRDRCLQSVARWSVVAVGVLIAALDPAQASKPGAENVHRADADCRGCHTAERDTLERDRVAARALLAADLEERCILCHGDEGPSHHTGIRPKTQVPDTLPLSAEGLITCATCHFMHGEQNQFGDFVRIDNGRGGLCLTCHQLSELE